MTQMIHKCDKERCIACYSCVVACKEGNHIPVGVARRWVVQRNEGTSDEESISLACRHCEEPKCVEACTDLGADVIKKRKADGIVQVDREGCISCESCVDACPYGVPKFLRDKDGNPTSAMVKCTFCAGGQGVKPFSKKEKELYGQNRIAEGKRPICSAFCSTKALMSGEKERINAAFKKRAAARS